VGVVADATGLLAILDVVIIAIVKMVAAMKGFLVIILVKKIMHLSAKHKYDG
jgi:hypothetical protein